jgi:hypothetical protein
MTRGLTAAQKTYTGPIFWTAIVRDKDWNYYYFWNGSKTKTIDEHSYLPYLQINSGFRRTKTLQVDSSDIAFDNTDLYMQALVQSVDFTDSLCIVSLYQFGLNSLVEIFRGRLANEQIDQSAVTYSLKQDFQPSEINLLLSYSTSCKWRFGAEACGYSNMYSLPVERLAQTITTDYGNYFIENSSLSMTEDVHNERFVIIDAGTGRGQVRRIKNNTTTRIEIYQPWSINPDGTSYFRVITRSLGVPKQLYTATSSVFSAEINKGTFTTRSVGSDNLVMTANEHASVSNDDAGVLRIEASIGHEPQLRRIKSNTDTTITIADDEPDLEFPLGDNFMVFYYSCPKDIQSACENRGFTYRFPGAPSLTPDVSRLYL